ncbi:MAG TPA: hypothetical protein VLU25_05625 [Acidobacteriota bacterium]|nr:hypothetical protein [Acidobacteriota bacterium]
MKTQTLCKVSYLLQWVLLLKAACVFLAAQDEVGNARLAVRGPRCERDGEETVLRVPDAVHSSDTLKTGPSAKLMVRLNDGCSLSLSNGATLPLETVDQARLEEGAIQVNSQGGRCTLWAGENRAETFFSSFIVACGRPWNTFDDQCLYVGVHGVTRVFAVALQPDAVPLRARYYTRIRGRERPDPNPPGRIDESLYLRLVDATRIIGTGSPLDRLDLNAAFPAWGDSFFLTRPPGVNLQDQVWDQPRPRELPPPPDPPEPPRR